MTFIGGFRRGRHCRGSRDIEKERIDRAFAESLAFASSSKLGSMSEMRTLAPASSKASAVAESDAPAPAGDKGDAPAQIILAHVHRAAQSVRRTDSRTFSSALNSQ